MPRFVEQEVRRRAGDPSESGNIELLIGYEENSSALAELVEREGGEILAYLPYNTLLASVPETAIQLVIEHPTTETVELDSGMETLQGN